MRTTICTSDWSFIPEHSVDDKIHYFKNRHTGGIIAEISVPGGFEYCRATHEQMIRHVVGDYIGRVISSVSVGREAGIMPYDETHVPRILRLDDEDY